MTTNRIILQHQKVLPIYLKNKRHKQTRTIAKDYSLHNIIKLIVFIFIRGNQLTGLISAISGSGRFYAKFYVRSNMLVDF